MAEGKRYQHEFKVGDRVRVIATGMEGEVAVRFFDGDYCLFMDGDERVVDKPYFHASELALAATDAASGTEAHHER